MEPVRRFLCCSAWISLGIVSWAEPATGQAQPPGDGHGAEREITAWIEQLDADRFLDREIASQQLIKAGGAAIPRLLAVLPNDSKEVTTRGIQLLEQLARSSDAQVAEDARLALEQLAESQTTGAGARARAGLRRVAEYWAARALGHLRQHGAVVSKLEPSFGLLSGTEIKLVIGEQWKGQPEDLMMLRWLSDVYELELEGPGVTDGWLKYVAVVTGIHTLTIKRAAITDEGIKQLASLQDVSEISLMYVPITDASIDALSRIKRVSQLRIYGAKITPEGGERLQERMAGTTIDRREGAFLGIGCQNLAQGCVVITVREETAAERAGLLPGDVVTRYRDQAVESFEQLTRLIAEDAAGDVVQVQIRRGDQRIAKRIELGQW